MNVKSLFAAVLVLAAAFAGAAALAGGATAAPPDALQAVKAATARYHSVEQAEKAGYVADAHCASSPAGGMGYHYANPALLADPALDPLQPEILVYAPKENGKLELVAVEY